MNNGTGSVWLYYGSVWLYSGSMWLYSGSVWLYIFLNGMKIVTYLSLLRCRMHFVQTNLILADCSFHLDAGHEPPDIVNISCSLIKH